MFREWKTNDIDLTTLLKTSLHQLKAEMLQHHMKSSRNAYYRDDDHLRGSPLSVIF